MDGFVFRKKRILSALNSDTPDKSPKGFVDEPLLPLIMLINKHESYVTTSSCSGRVCTYLEGIEESQEDDAATDSGQTSDVVGRPDEYDASLQAVEVAKHTKGGQWLFVSHDPIVTPVDMGSGNQHWVIKTLFGPEAHRVVLMEDIGTVNIQNVACSQLVYFKFEPMILHIEASTPESAKTFLNHSLHSGYRNSGILPSPKRTMLAVRSTLKLDVPIAYVSRMVYSSSKPESSSGSTPEPRIYLMVSLAYLCTLIELSNDKFQKNFTQIHRFEEQLSTHLGVTTQDPFGTKKGDRGEWEDKDARRERKRREGLQRQQEIAKAKAEVGENNYGDQVQD
ncbi:hypothetical protein BGX34_008075 [Mortierella sp. NVP85]|nr:hypothetical protein BGX34_008075 [Mortierella sp. NVP85]